VSQRYPAGSCPHARKSRSRPTIASATARCNGSASSRCRAEDLQILPSMRRWGRPIRQGRPRGRQPPIAGRRTARWTGDTFWANRQTTCGIQPATSVGRRGGRSCLVSPLSAYDSGTSSRTSRCAPRRKRGGRARAATLCRPSAVPRSSRPSGRPDRSHERHGGTSGDDRLGPQALLRTSVATPTGGSSMSASCAKPPRRTSCAGTSTDVPLSRSGAGSGCRSGYVRGGKNSSRS